MRSLILSLVCFSTQALISRLAACGCEKSTSPISAVFLAGELQELGTDREASLSPQSVGHAKLVRSLDSPRIPLAEEPSVVGVALRQVFVKVQRFRHLGLGLTAGPGGCHRQG